MEYEVPSNFAMLAKTATYGAKLWVAWCTLVAFIGGQLPIPVVLIISPGGLKSALLFLVIGGPALYLLVRIVTTAVLMLVTRKDRREFYRAARRQSQKGEVSAQ